MSTLSELLTMEELQRLTGYKLPSKQIRQLKRMGIPYIVNRYDHPIVSRIYVRGILGEKDARAKSKRAEIDVEALLAAQGGRG